MVVLNLTSAVWLTLCKWRHCNVLTAVYNIYCLCDFFVDKVYKAKVSVAVTVISHLEWSNYILALTMSPLNSLWQISTMFIGHFTADIFSHIFCDLFTNVLSWALIYSLRAKCQEVVVWLRACHFMNPLTQV